VTDSARIGLDVTQAVKRRGRGIARYIRQVVGAMPADGLEADLFIRGHRWFRRALFDDVAPQLRRRWLANPARLAARDLSLFHSFGNHLPRQAPCPLSFTVHDVRALDEPAGYEGKERLQRNIGRAAGIVCLTEYGRERLAHHVPDLDERVVAVIPHGVDHDLFRPLEAPVRRETVRDLGLGSPFLLQLGSWFPHKNLELSLEAWARSESRRQGFDLAFVGGGAPQDYQSRLEELAARLGVSRQVHWIDHVGAPDLPALIGEAACLLQPSRYEGFALPLLEAMACGTPGVVSSASCLPEVSAGIWPIADPDDAAGFADGIDRVVLDEAARQAAVREGLAHAAQFTWERSARAHDAFYREVAARAGR
jgi:glycosyltransferase involved in cell wall biosynthesis